MTCKVHFSQKVYLKVRTLYLNKNIACILQCCYTGSPMHRENGENGQKQFPVHRENREFRNFAKTRGILFARVVNSLILKVKDMQVV